METEQLETVAKPLPNIPEHKKKRTQEEVPAGVLNRWQLGLVPADVSMVPAADFDALGR
mgnify:CR=1 FL=1